MWHTGLSSRVVSETKKTIDTNKLGPRNVPPNLIDNVEGKGKGGWAKGLVDETQDRGKPLQPMKKGMRERMNGLGTKATRLPAILRRCTSRSSVREIGSSHGNVRDKRANSAVQLRRNRVLQHTFLSGRCQTALSRSKRTMRGTVERTRASNHLE